MCICSYCQQWDNDVWVNVISRQKEKIKTEDDDDVDFAEIIVCVAITEAKRSVNGCMNANHMIK